MCSQVAKSLVQESVLAIRSSELAFYASALKVCGCRGEEVSRTDEPGYPAYLDRNTAFGEDGLLPLFHASCIR